MTARASPSPGWRSSAAARRPKARTCGKGGKILDPENGKEYRASFTPIDGGARLEVRGYLGPFWRTQVWQRVQ